MGRKKNRRAEPAECVMGKGWQSLKTCLWPVSNVVLLLYQAGSTVARRQHSLVSDVEFSSVEFIAVPKQKALRKNVLKSNLIRLK